MSSAKVAAILSRGHRVKATYSVDMLFPGGNLCWHGGSYYSRQVHVMSTGGLTSQGWDY